MFKIITQTDDFIVVAKSAGVNFHDEEQHGSGLFSQVKKQMEEQFSVTELYPVHRLDKMTSGLVLFAKNLNSAQVFGKLFESHLIEKYYLAISDNKPTKKQGLIKGDMAKSRRGMFKLLRTMDNPAITQFFSYSIANKQRLYLLKPHSGKTHQLRVALSSISAPIVGDPLYNASSIADRGYLHAYALRFDYLGTHYEFSLAPSEGEFYLSTLLQNKLTEIEQPWLLNWPKKI
jgi:tRNA pseudouridine32 synthase/23S rRNA pseudouridine746 synthase